MHQAFEEAIRWVVLYFRDAISLPLAAAVTLVAVGVPVLHAARRKNGRWTDPKRVLQIYVGLILVALISLWGLGIILQQIAPAIFETWRQDLNSARGTGPATLLFKFALALPLAFGVSSVAYGALGGWAKLALGLLGVGAAVGLAAMAIVGGILVGCSGWSSCP